MRLSFECTHYYLLELIWNICRIWKWKNSRFNFFISLFYIFWLKWWPTKGKSITNNTKTPNINLTAMTFRFKYLRRNIVRSTTDCFSFLTWILEFGSKSKISHFNFHILVKEQISKLKISMNNFTIM
jgi:hypothetical protein